MQVDESEQRLTPDEESLCMFVEMTLAEAQRSELRALYEIAQRVNQHRATVSDLSKSLERCALRVRRNRSTLHRYAQVGGRIKPAEFAELLKLSDQYGYPLNFWDLIAVADLTGC